MPDRVLALAAHPDDIEFMMAGTLILLREAGFEIHYMNVATGSCGTDSLPVDEIVRLRAEEARAAAALVGAEFHPSLCHDMEVLYEPSLLKRMGAVVREIAPSIILTQGYDEYMEDHSNVCRLAVSAAFSRGMRNFRTEPEHAPVDTPVTLYHALPYGLRSRLNQLVRPGFVVDISGTLEEKRKMLACHRSQKEWLDHSQGLDAYLETQASMSQEVGALTGRCQHGEGWTRHLPLGLCPADADPLRDALGARIHPVN